MMDKSFIVEFVSKTANALEMLDRMKNCINCDHYEVCLAVARRKAEKANDYSPCTHWKMVDDRG